MKKQFMLKKNKEFRYVIAKGKSEASPYMVLVYAKNRNGKKAGFSVSARLGGAVVRNRTKRIMRAGFDALMPACRDGYAYLFIARAKLIGANASVAQSAMKELLQRAGVYE